MKWVDYDQMKAVPLPDGELSDKIIRIAKKSFLSCKGVGYGRLDMRVDSKENVYVLELNANPGIFYKPNEMGMSDFCLSFDKN